MSNPRYVFVLGKTNFWFFEKAQAVTFLEELMSLGFTGQLLITVLV